jgi:hypothetical protein
MEPSAVRVHAVLSRPGEARSFLRRALIFIAIGIGLYVLIYAAAERLVHEYAHRNRFFVVRSAPPGHFDGVILGASHAAALDYQDMTSRLEQLTGARIMNLAVVGGGITVNRILVEYFLSRHTTSAVVYVVDSFAFYSREWNEDRVRDSRLFERAPLDPALARILARHPPTRGVALDYLSGFSKINNPNRFAPDVFADEAGRFERVYRPVGQIDRQRIAYLYPESIDPDIFSRYLVEFEELVAFVTGRGIRFVAVRPPIPERIRKMLPGEAEFDARFKQAMDSRQVEYHDFSMVNNDERLFYDSDHLNKAGVMSFFERHFAGLFGSRR